MHAREAEETMDDETIDADQARVKRLLKDPRVIVHYQKTREPFVSELRVLPHVDVLDLLERRDREDCDEIECCKASELTSATIDTNAATLATVRR